MLLYLLAFAGGILTIVSPCILPILPFVFSRAGQPFRRTGLPLLAGMAGTCRSGCHVGGRLGSSGQPGRPNPRHVDFRRAWAGIGVS
jgi:hypothetical protein